MVPRMHTSTDGAPVFRFGPAAGFMAELKSRVDAYFHETGRRHRGGAALYAKALVILGWLAASYVFLVFFAAAWWAGVLAAVSLAFAIAAVGFNIQHDGNHGSFSESERLNRLASWGLDLLGGSSYMWRYQHNTFHHTYTNLAGADDDISLGVLGRLSPAQPYYRFHRYQHLYVWPLYAFIALRWQLWGDFRMLVTGRIGPQRIKRPRGRDLAGFVAGKLLLAGTAFVVPALVRPFWQVLLFYAGTMMLTGFLLAIVFQLAHSVDAAEHPAEAEGRLAAEWAVHQVETTVDFARRNRLLTWYVGGLNYQVEHHLFPRIAHVHYPAIARIVEETCARFGVRYRAYRSLAGVLASHYRFLREMGRPPRLAA